LLLGYPGCFDCVVDQVTSAQSYGDAQNTCATNPAPPLAFLGANSSIILSKYPLANQDSYVLPSTNYRRAVLYAQVQFPGTPVDFYCGFLDSPLVASSLPYEGCFGDGNGSMTSTASEQSYLAENLYEAQLMAGWVAKKSGASMRPAVVLGDWHAGSGTMSGAGPEAGVAPTALGAPTISFLSGQQGWQAAAAATWPAGGQCNFCPDNPLDAPATVSYFFLQPFLYGWPAGAGGTPVISEQLIFTDDVITIAAGDASAANAPLSPYYGLNITVTAPSP
jgi:hypothetical protein